MAVRTARARPAGDPAGAPLPADGRLPANAPPAQRCRTRGARPSRDHGRPEPLERQRGEQADAVDLGPHVHLDADARRLVVELVAEGGALRLEQQRVVGQVGQRHAGVRCQRVVVGGEDDALLVEQRLGRQLASRQRQVDDGQVEALRDDLRDERGGGGVDDTT
jgi:hypothetical protein